MYFGLNFTKKFIQTALDTRNIQTKRAKTMIVMPINEFKTPNPKTHLQNANIPNIKNDVKIYETNIAP